MRKPKARYLPPSTHLHSALLSEEDRSAWEAGLVPLYWWVVQGVLGLKGPGPSPHSGPMGPGSCAQAWGSLWAGGEGEGEVLYRGETEPGRQGGWARAVGRQMKGSMAAERVHEGWPGGRSYG